MEDALWEVTWINAAMYLGLIPDMSPEESPEDEFSTEIVSPEDELKYIKLGKIE